jgi:hypothetical protein
MREAGGDGAMWKGRARTMLKGLMSALCYKRDKFGMLLDINVIRDYFPLDKIIALSRDVDLKANARDPIRKYLLDLPGFTEESVLTGEIAPKAYEQHNYLTMQLTEVMSDLSETYGKIFGVPLGEIDFKDVLFNRRILFCLLPSLEKDPDALEGLGKLVVAGLRSALAPALGSRVEGLKREVIDTKPTTSKVPFFIILDEYGYYAVQGFAVVAAQARSLGVSVIFAGQDIPSLKKASEEEAKATIANTNIKICMKLEDPDDTAKVYEMRGGQANVAKSEHHENAIFSYTKKGETRLQKEQKIDVRDLVNQDPGEAHVIFRDELSRCRFFYYEPFEVSEVKLNKFIMIDKPKESLILKLKGATKKLDDMFKEKKFPDNKVETSDNGLKGLLYDLKWAVQYNDSPEEAAIFGFGMIELRSILKDSSLDSTLQDNMGGGVDIEKDRNDRNELDDEFKQLEQAGDKARTYFNENSENNDNDESTSEFVSEIDDADINIQLNRMFDSFEAMDDDELLGFFDDVEDNEDSEMHKNALSVSDEFSKLLNESVVNNAKNNGIKGKDITDATSQLADKESKKVAENDMNMLSESSEYPSGRTPSKMGRDEINNSVREMLSRLDSEKSKIS